MKRLWNTKVLNIVNQFNIGKVMQMRENLNGHRHWERISTQCERPERNTILLLKQYFLLPAMSILITVFLS